MLSTPIPHTSYFPVIPRPAHHRQPARRSAMGVAAPSPRRNHRTRTGKGGTPPDEGSHKPRAPAREVMDRPAGRTIAEA